MNTVHVVTCAFFAFFLFFEMKVRLFGKIVHGFVEKYP